jgi:hypothetical protein
MNQWENHGIPPVRERCGGVFIFLNWGAMESEFPSHMIDMATIEGDFSSGW